MQYHHRLGPSPSHPASEATKPRLPVDLDRRLPSGPWCSTIRAARRRSITWHPGRPIGRARGVTAGVRSQRPTRSVDRVFERQISLMRGGTRPIAPIHAEIALMTAFVLPSPATGEPSGDSRIKFAGRIVMNAPWHIETRFGHKQTVIDRHSRWREEIGSQIGWTGEKILIVTCESPVQ